MPVPTAYTEETFAQYLHKTLSRAAEELGWLDGGGQGVGDYGEIINDTLIACQAGDIADLVGRSNVQKLRVVGRYYAWRAAVEALVVEHNLAADGASLQREAVFAQAKSMLDRVAEEAAVYEIGPLSPANYSAEILGVARSDPYSPIIGGQ